MESTEKWLPVVGYEGKYEVSDHGRVRSVARLDSIGRQIYGKLLTLRRRESDDQPYGRALLRDGKSGREFRVAPLVLEAFVGPRPAGNVACHNDGNPLNDHVSNLRWDTQAGNMHDALIHGTRWDAGKSRCKRNHILAPPNLYLPPSKMDSRICLACRREQNRAYKAGRPMSDELANAEYDLIMATAKAA